MALSESNPQFRMEVIVAMKEIGRLCSLSYEESSEGGLAATEDANENKKKSTKFMESVSGQHSVREFKARSQNRH